MSELSKELFDLRNVVETLIGRVESLEVANATLQAENALLQSENALLKSENAALKLENAALKTEIAGLKTQVNQHSKNSHKPPSSDGYGKKPALPKTSDKKRGGQVGHKGHTLKKVEKPDHIILHLPTQCACCYQKFSSEQGYEIGQTRQVFDIPEPRLIVTEHQQGIIHCCGKAHKGVFPDEVTQPVQYGNQIRSLSVLLNNDYKLPIEKIAQLFADLLGSTFNVSTILKSNSVFCELLAPVQAQIKEEILNSPVVHFDETGMRVESKLNWFHTASTGLWTYLFVHEKRGKVALNDDLSVLPKFKNWAVHDCWASYFQFEDCQHALCNAHILRELQARIENGSDWAAKMHQFLLDLLKKTKDPNDFALLKAQKVDWVQRYEAICELAQTQEPTPPKTGARGKPKQSKGRNLLNRLVKYQNGILAFAFETDIPFTNNQAERDIRCLKTKQKVATSFRTKEGATQYATIQSFLSSVRKHKQNVFHAINNIFNKNHNWAYA